MIKLPKGVEPRWKGGVPICKGDCRCLELAGANFALLCRRVPRDFVLPDDVKALVLPALAHRMILSPRARLRDMSTEQVIQETLETLPVPGGDFAIK